MRNIALSVARDKGEEKVFRWSGANTFTGIMVNMDGPVEQSGAGTVRGSILAGGDVNLSGRSYTASGAGSLTYDQNVVGSLQTSGGAIVRTVADTWQKIQPTAALAQ